MSVEQARTEAARRAGRARREMTVTDRLEELARLAQEAVADGHSIFTFGAAGTSADAGDVLMRAEVVAALVRVAQAAQALGMWDQSHNLALALSALDAVWRRLPDEEPAT